MTRETGMAISAAPVTDAAEARPLNESDDMSAASSAPTAAPVATPTPPNTCAMARMSTIRRWIAPRVQVSRVGEMVACMGSLIRAGHSRTPVGPMRRCILLHRSLDSGRADP